jgi:hypothetical protein
VRAFNWQINETQRTLLVPNPQVELIWSNFHPTIPNLLYILNRYVCLGFFINAIYGTSCTNDCDLSCQPWRHIRRLVFVDIYDIIDIAGFRPHLSESYCRKPAQVIGFILAHLCWTSIMALRVSALWSQNKPLVRVIWILWVGTMGTVITTAVRSYMQVIGMLVLYGNHFILT